MPVRFQPSERDRRLSAVLVDADETTGKARSIERIEERLPDAPG